MLHLIYTFIYCLLLFFLLPKEYFRRPADIRRKWFREKIGLFDKNPSLKKTIWIHAVSVGEVISITTFLRKLYSTSPDLNLIVSTVTDTGQKIAKERLSDIAKIIYFPLDIPYCIKRAIDNLNPSTFMIIETELWPNMLKELKKKSIPILLVNGRISQKSFSGYKKIKYFIKDVLKNIDFYLMQNALYAERIIQLGAPQQRVYITGSFKFDVQPSTSPSWTKLLKGRILVAGSTHYPEEEIILDSFLNLLTEFDNLILILAPRHPERFEEVEELVKSKNLNYIKRTDIETFDQTLKGPLVILLNVIGELASIYAICDIAIIGGSFIKHGGQNPLEPAYWGKVIICGPSMENFPFIEEFIKEKAIIMSSKKDLYDDIFRLLKKEEDLEKIGKKARDLYYKNSGATDRVLKILKDINVL
ncbi:MAG: 3-deoxy-D-manno-octulosonic acid transferase [Thermodesulfovibrionales bacterium]|nr:3-deoxy-D-manno-octulosonic acid transferase [Thermodesulfovibrionales bacterium]